MGGNGPYREAGTTLASAILSAKDIHNHLVSHSHSHVAHVLSLDVPFAPHRSRRFFPYSKREGDPSRKRSLDVFTSPFLPSSHPVSNSLNFLLLLSVSFDARENFRNFARPFKASIREETKFRLYFAVETGARNKGRRLRFLPRFTSFRPGALCRSALLY